MAKRKPFDKKEYKELEIKRIPALSNSALFKETIRLAGGDDYDGCFTEEGGVTYPLLLEELENRLVTSQFMLTPVFKDEVYPVE